MYPKQLKAVMDKEVASFDVHDVYVEVDLDKVPKDAKLLGCV